MVLKVVPATEQDALDWARIYYPAFSPYPLSVLWKSPPSEESTRAFAKALASGLSKPGSYTFKCIDIDLDNKLIAVAKWSVYEKPRTPKEVESTFVLRDTGVEENREARAAFMQGIWRSRRETMGGQPHVILESLICDPAHHRRGAGRLLVQWGLDKADELGVPAYLEGSIAGVKLYKSVGYEVVGELVFDTTPYGGTLPDVHQVGFQVVKAATFADLKCRS
jgi:GNAT superfamily N-acetyltransferase